MPLSEKKTKEVKSQTEKNTLRKRHFQGRRVDIH